MNESITVSKQLLNMLPLSLVFFLKRVPVYEGEEEQGGFVSMDGLNSQRFNFSKVLRGVLATNTRRGWLGRRVFHAKGTRKENTLVNSTV